MDKLLLEVIENSKKRIKTMDKYILEEKMEEARMRNI